MSDFELIKLSVGESAIVFRADGQMVVYVAYEGEEETRHEVASAKAAAALVMLGRAHPKELGRLTRCTDLKKEEKS